MQATLSQASCRRQSTTSTHPPTPQDNPALYLVSPFFGDSAVMVLGNTGIAVCAVLIHVSVSLVVAAVRPERSPPETARTLAEVFTMTRFPHLSIVLAHACVQGVQLGAWQLLWDAIQLRPPKHVSIAPDVVQSIAGSAVLGIFGLAVSVAPTIISVKLRSVLLRGLQRSSAGKLIESPWGDDACHAVEVDSDAPAKNNAVRVGRGGQGAWLPALALAAVGVDTRLEYVPLVLLPDASRGWVVLLRYAGPARVWSPQEFLRRFSCVFSALSDSLKVGPWLLAEQWAVSLLVTLVSAADPPSNQFVVCNALMVLCFLFLIAHMTAVLWLRPFRLPLKNPLKVLCVGLLALGCLLSAPMFGEGDAVHTTQSAIELMQAVTVMTLGVYEVLIFIAIDRARDQSNSPIAPLSLSDVDELVPMQELRLLKNGGDVSDEVVPMQELRLLKNGGDVSDEVPLPMPPAADSHETATRQRDDEKILFASAAKESMPETALAADSYLGRLSVVAATSTMGAESGAMRDEEVDVTGGPHAPPAAAPPPPPMPSLNSGRGANSGVSPRPQRGRTPRLSALSATNPPLQHPQGRNVDFSSTSSSTGSEPPPPEPSSDDDL
jgi:hypothetical protein